MPYPWAAMTDADGRYEIKGIPAGTYAIAAIKPNYVRSAYGAERVEGPGKRMTLTDGQVLDKIDLRLVARRRRSPDAWSTSSAIR